MPRASMTITPNPMQSNRGGQSIRLFRVLSFSLVACLFLQITLKVRAMSPQWVTNGFCGPKAPNLLNNSLVHAQLASLFLARQRQPFFTSAICVAAVAATAATPRSSQQCQIQFRPMEIRIEIKFSRLEAMSWQLCRAVSINE